MEKTEISKTNHLLIGGTGRAGTSFLVKYLTAMGLDTHLSRNKEKSEWYESANAGLEDFPIKDISDNLPYVIKSPWLFEFIEQVLLDKNMSVDAVIIPIRDLIDVATSRVVLEREKMNQSLEHLLYMNKTWDAFANTSGGIVFSLNPIDQARILAVGFHHVIHKIVQADIPIIFLDFPRFIEDSNYLFEKLKNFLPNDMTNKIAHAIHQTIADTSKVRVSQEKLQKDLFNFIDDDKITHTLSQVPSADQINNMAIRRELLKMKKQMRESEIIISQKNEQISQINNELSQKKDEVIQINEQISQISNELSQKKDEIFQINEEISQKNKEFFSITQSLSWRITKPLRSLKKYMSRILEF